MFTKSSIYFQALYSKTTPFSTNDDNDTTKISNDTRPTVDQLNYPKYLQHTTYAELVCDQYRTATQQQSVNHCSTTESVLLHHSQQKVQYRHESQPESHLADLRLPTRWNNKDRAKHIAVDSQGLTLKYIGPGKTEAHAGSVRANFPMRSQTGLFYYEVKIVSKGEDGYIGIGFCTKKNDLERLPGWDKDSYGYHGDDGHAFAGSGIGDSYGPKFTSGDIIGCGVNFTSESAFYTKNGLLIGTAFSSLDLTKQYYPVIGLRTPGEHVMTNFGDDDFVFDVELYMKEQATMLWKDIAFLKPTHLLGNDMTALVMDYLLHHGYDSTAKTLSHDYQHTTKNPFGQSHLDRSKKEVKQRQDIRHAIKTGDTSESIHLANLYYRQEGSDILLELQCCELLEIIHKLTSHLSAQRHTDWNCADLHPINSTPPHLTDTADFSHIPIDLHSNNYIMDIGSDMTVPSPLSLSPISTYSSLSYNTAGLISSSLESSAGLECPVTKVRFDMSDAYVELLLGSAMVLGQEVQDSCRLNNPTRIKEQLADVLFSITNSDMENNPLLGSAYRDILTSKLNTVILGKLNTEKRTFYSLGSSSSS
ncbi:concanavalin A-like lectin/glucanase domain-containing protein [Chlamydoabsidia padenii]|nr:concanavalin A-like lectin/glucanase domain-containing protein [Chlamydoabsidia padenii]